MSIRRVPTPDYEKPKSKNNFDIDTSEYEDLPENSVIEEDAIEDLKNEKNYMCPILSLGTIMSTYLTTNNNYHCCLKEECMWFTKNNKSSGYCSIVGRTK